MKLTVLDSLTDAGHEARPNEDAYGASDGRAFVIDGATGLGNQPLMTGDGSDARWLSHFARDGFLELVDRPVAEMVREINRRAKEEVHAASVGIALEAWALPVAGFQMVSVEDGTLVTYGLGDCRLFILANDSGESFDTSALKESYAAERERARAALSRSGRLATPSSLTLDCSVQADLRAGRARYNTPEGPLWTLGTAPQAADYIVRESVPFSGSLTGLLCTDGFAALRDQYELYDTAGLVAAARDCGLGTLLAELRHMERNRDPDGRLYPRYKVSDDATALLFEIHP